MNKELVRIGKKVVHWVVSKQPLFFRYVTIVIKLIHVVVIIKFGVKVENIKVQKRLESYNSKSKSLN